MNLLRRAGRWLREYVRPMVGFWEVLDRLEDLRARMDRLEANQMVLAPAVSSVGDRLHHVVTNQERLIARDGPLAAVLSREVDRLHHVVANQFHHVVTNQERLIARDGPLAAVLSREVDRLDGYLAYHAASLHDSLAAMRGDLKTITVQPDRVYAAQGLDAIVMAGDYDLVVPTEETGLLVYLLRHGPDAIEPGVRAILQGRLQPGAIAIDVGANIGIHTLAMAMAVGAAGRVISFEPLPHLAAALRRTVNLNGFGERTEVRQIALADAPGETTFHRAAHGPMSSLYPLPGHMAPQAIQVRMAALDDCIAPGARVDLVKVDVEGAEPRVWRGMRRTLNDNPDIAVVLEWSGSHFRRSGEDPAAFMAEIRAAGFDPRVIVERNGTGSLALLPGDIAELEGGNLLLARHVAA
jgi:FkbM family methyltransferase